MSSPWPRLLLAAWLLLAQSMTLAHERDHERTLDAQPCTVCITGHSLLGTIDVDATRVALLTDPGAPSAAAECPAPAVADASQHLPRAPPRRHR